MRQHGVQRRSELESADRTGVETRHGFRTEMVAVAVVVVRLLVLGPGGGHLSQRFLYGSGGLVARRRAKDYGGRGGRHCREERRRDALLPGEERDR